MKIRTNNLTVTHKKCVLTVSLLFFGFVTHAKAQLTDVIRPTLTAQQKTRDLQAKAQSLAATAQTVSSIFSDINRMDDSVEKEINKAITIRQNCLAQSANKDKSNGIFCPQEPRSLKLLNEQLFTQMKLKRLGSIGVARAVLCLTSYAIKPATRPKDLFFKLSPELEEALEQAKNVYSTFSDDAKSELEEKCKPSNFGSQGDEFTFSTTLGQISRQAVLREAYQVVANNCGYNYAELDSNMNSTLQKALNHCQLIDRHGAKTDAEAAENLKKIRLDEQREEWAADIEAWKEANDRMLKYTSDVYRYLTPVYLQRYAPQCKDFSSINWSENNPWRISFDCFFGPSEYHYFNPFTASGETHYSVSQELRKPLVWPFADEATPVERRSLAWMKNFIRSHTTARKAFFDECVRRTSQVPRPQKWTVNSIEGGNLHQTCHARGVVLLQVSHLISSQGTISQQPRFLVNGMLPSQ